MVVLVNTIVDTKRPLSKGALHWLVSYCLFISKYSTCSKTDDDYLKIFQGSGFALLIDPLLSIWRCL